MDVKGLVGVFFALLAGCVVVACAYDEECHRGRATYYTYNNDGSCSFGAVGSPTLSTPYFAAPNEAWYDGAVHCGECYEITGVKGTVTVMIADMCPVEGNEKQCSGDRVHFDLSPAAFSAIGELAWGVTDHNYHMVPCGYSRDLGVVVTDGSSEYWIALLAHHHEVGVSTVEIEVDGAWVNLGRAKHNMFIGSFSSGLVAPCNVKVTSVRGDVVSGQLSAFSPGTNATMSGNFPSFTPMGTCMIPLPWEYMYYDKLDDSQYGWDDWAAAVPKDLSAPNPASGQYCIGGTLQGWKGWQFGRKQWIRNEWFTHVEFDVRVVSSSPPRLRVSLNASTFAGYDLDDSVLSSEWKHVKLSVADDLQGTPGWMYNKIEIQNYDSNAIELYMDNVHFRTSEDLRGNHYSPNGDSGLLSSGSPRPSLSRFFGLSVFV